MPLWRNDSLFRFRNDGGEYGTMRTTVLGLTVVFLNDDIIKTGSRAKKTSAGYNLTNLFVGSEGTLG